MCSLLQLCEELFSEYIRYFLERSLSRRFTLREWWMQCCHMARIDPTLQLPFHDFHAEIRRQLGSFLLNVAMESCTFPLPPKGSLLYPFVAFVYIRLTAVKRRIGGREIIGEGVFYWL